MNNFQLVFILCENYKRHTNPLIRKFWEMSLPNNQFSSKCEEWLRRCSPKAPKCRPSTIEKNVIFKFHLDKLLRLLSRLWDLIGGDRELYLSYCFKGVRYREAPKTLCKWVSQSAWPNVALVYILYILSYNRTSVMLD